MEGSIVKILQKTKESKIKKTNWAGKKSGGQKSDRFIGTVMVELKPM